MPSLKQRIVAFEKLGRFMAQHSETRSDADLQKLNRYFLDGYRHALDEAYSHNNWFTPDNLKFAVEQWSEALRSQNLEQWVAQYPAHFFEPRTVKTVAIIMAGNLPLVGFHDLISVLLSGHRALVKPSSDDAQLLPILLQVLVALEREWAKAVELSDGQIKNFEAVIATGSNNSARYFEQYFGKYPCLVRKNRSSVAVLRGEESEADLQKLGEDIFRYFGLGCRNVSKAYLPQDFDVQRFFKAFFPFEYVAQNNKYSNNYDYNRAIYMMEHQPFLENGFFIIRENSALHAPVAVLHYERYRNEAELRKKIAEQADELQCVVAAPEWWDGAVAFGHSQRPNLWDYADGRDTLQFLHQL